MNIKIDEGDSAYNRRHQSGQFKGLSIPFGSLIDFRPPEIVLQRFPKFHKKSLPGLFLGYAQHVGGRWPGDYLVSPLEDFQVDNQSRIARIFRIKEIIPNNEHQFPLRDVADRISRTIGPHGEPTQIHIPGATGSTQLHNKIPTKVQEFNEGSKPIGPNQVIDHGSGQRQRYKNSLRPIGYPTETWNNTSPEEKSKILSEMAEVSIDEWKSYSKSKKVEVMSKMKNIC